MGSFEHVEHIHEVKFNFSQHGSAWLSHFAEALTATGSQIEFSHVQLDSTVNGSQFHLKANNQNLSSVLLARESGDKVIFEAVSRMPLDRQVVETLRDVVLKSVKSAKQTTQHFRWSGLLSQVPQSIGEDPTFLKGSLTIGDLTLEAVENVFYDAVPSSPIGHVLGSTYRVNQSIPIRVKGHTPASSWDNASADVTRTLRTLCGLLALAWPQTYELADSPMPLSSGERQGRSTRAGVTLQDQSAHKPVDWIAHPIPEWLTSAWNKLNASPQLRAAVDAFLEARYLQERHQSMALVAYTASIEAIAKQLYEPKRCDNCKSVLGLAESYRSAIREVLPDQQARELARLYGRRSKTVHEGRLHGTESKPTFSMLDIFAGDYFSNFSTQLPQLARAARELIVRALTEELPPKRHHLAE
jgi:hypothetical protein